MPKIQKDKTEDLKSTQSDISVKKSQKNGMRSSFLEVASLIKNKINKRKNRKIDSKQAVINDLVLLAGVDLSHDHQEYDLIRNLNQALDRKNLEIEIKNAFDAALLSKTIEKEDFDSTVQEIFSKHNYPPSSPNSESTASNTGADAVYDQPNLKVQSDNQAVKQSKIFLEKIKGLFNFSAKIEARNQQKEKAKQLVGSYLNERELVNLKKQDYSEFKKDQSKVDLEESKSLLSKLENFSERERKVKRSLIVATDDLQMHKLLTKFEKHEISKLKKEVKRSSEKTTQAQINVIGDMTSGYLKEIEKIVSLKKSNNETLTDLKTMGEDINNYLQKYNKLTENYPNKRNEAIELNFLDLNSFIKKMSEKSATTKSENTPEQNEQKNGNAISYAYSLTREETKSSLQDASLKEGQELTEGQEHRKNSDPRP